MDHPVLITDFKSVTTKRPVLIIDKYGQYGKALAAITAQDLVTIIVTKDKLSHQKNIMYVPFKRAIPVIPDNTFSYILVVYKGEGEILDILPALHKKALESNARIAFIMPVRLGNQKFYKQLLSKFYRLSLIVVGDVFGQDWTESNLVSDFIDQVQRHGTIVIPNSGLFKTYPVFYDDVIRGLIESVFVRDLAHQTYALLPHHPVTALSLARMMQSISPLVKIDFLKTHEPIRPVSIPEQTQYLIPVSYSVLDQFKRISLAPPKRTTNSKKRSFRRKPHKSLSIILGLGMLLVALLPFLVPFLFATTGVVLLSQMRQQVLTGEYEKAMRIGTLSENAFSLAQETSVTAGGIVSLVGLSSRYNDYTASLDSGKGLARLGQQLLSARALYESIQNGTSQKPKDDFLKTLHALRQSSVAIETLLANKKTPVAIKEIITPYLPSLKLFSSTNEIFPTLLGFNGKKRYLVLLQNNMELRPGGGFIGSYALVNFEQGRMTKFSVHNVYDADGQSKGRVDPPYPLRRYMGVQNLFLRDSNFSVDFVKNAAQAAYLLELETKERVDGVIALDTTVIQALLSVTGPLSLPLYNETVTAENFYLITEKRSDENFFPGSRQKQDFLKAVFTGLEAMLQDPAVRSDPKLLIVMTEAFRQKHMLIAVSDPAVQNVLTVANLSGSLWDGKQRDEKTINDSFGINEANIGENKANYALERTVSHVVTLAQSQLTEEVTINYTNEKKGNGTYEAYIQLVVPKEKKLTGIQIDNNVQEIVAAITDPLRYERASFTPPTGLELEEKEEGLYTVYGFLFIVPENTKKKLTVLFQSQNTLTSKDFRYTTLIRKQPGSKADPYVFTIKYPQGVRVIEKDATLLEREQQITWFGPHASDLVFSSRFTK